MSCVSENQNKLVLTLSNTEFTYCRICGIIYTHDVLEARRRWSRLHAKRHSDKEHAALARTGIWLTPEAAFKLAAYGIVDVIGLVIDNDVQAAYREAE